MATDATDMPQQGSGTPSFRGRAPLDASAIQSHVYHLQTRGYTVIDGFLSAAECEFFKQRLAAAVQDEAAATGKAEQEHIQDLLARDLAFCRLLEDPRLQLLVEPLLGKAWVMYAFTTSSVPPAGTNYGHRIHVDSPRLIPGYATNIGLIWALDPFKAENGATEVLPGSHHNAQVPAEDLFERARVQVTCAGGALIVFQARLFHRAGRNSTPHWRHSLTMNVCRPYMKQRMDWVRVIPRAFSDSLDEQARRLIGFDTRVPASMEEYLLPADQRLYKANQE